jgi:hypothetical protein
VLQVEKVDIDLSKQKHKIYLKTVSANEWRYVDAYVLISSFVQVIT